MKSTDIKAAGEFLHELEQLEADHGIFLKSDRMVKLVGAGDRPKNMGMVGLNGARDHQWWVG